MPSAPWDEDEVWGGSEALGSVISKRMKNPAHLSEIRGLREVICPLLRRDVRINSSEASAVGLWHCESALLFHNGSG